MTILAAGRWTAGLSAALSITARFVYPGGDAYHRETSRGRPNKRQLVTDADAKPSTRISTPIPRSLPDFKPELIDRPNERGCIACDCH
jgi:hypothetical protein